MFLCVIYDQQLNGIRFYTSLSQSLERGCLSLNLGESDPYYHKLHNPVIYPIYIWSIIKIAFGDFVLSWHSLDRLMTKGINREDLMTNDKDKNVETKT